MPREMIDACNAKNVPRDALIVAGYVDGKCAWSPEDWALFPRAIKVRISSIGTNDGEVLDVEPLNLDARQAVGWVRMRRAAGIDPTVYTAEWAPAGALYGPYGYTYADCVREFDAAGEPQPHYWIAPLNRRLPDGSLRAPYVPDWPGVVAAQWDYPGPIDRNIVADYWPGIDTKGGWLMALSDAQQQEIYDFVHSFPETWGKVLGWINTASDDADKELEWGAGKGGAISGWVPLTLKDIQDKVSAYVVGNVDYDKLADRLLSRIKAQWVK